MSRNEDIVESYFDAGGRNIGELARKYDLWSEAIYAIVAAGGAEIDLGPRPKAVARAPMMHALNTSGRTSNADLYRGRGRKPGTAIKLHLTGEELLAAVEKDGVPAVAHEHGVSPATVYVRMNAMGYSRTKGNMPGPKVKSGPKPRELRAYGGVQRRFVSAKSDPAQVKGLRDDHPAVVEGRTLFPSRVFSPWDSPRFFVAGRNSPKTGDRVTKGAWAGMPIYTLTLEERRTCPRTCAVWNTCYGSGMPYSRRNDAFHPDFIPALACEAVTLARQHPDGFVVRLHILGDFFSVAYVRCWGLLLDLLPNLHVFGYTARHVEDPDPLSAAIAREIQRLNDRWDRWAIRTSHTVPGPDRTIVVMAPSDDPDVLACPAQTEKSECCATCGLCWSPSARGKTISFTLHGNTMPGPRK